MPTRRPLCWLAECKNPSSAQRAGAELTRRNWYSGPPRYWQYNLEDPTPRRHSLIPFCSVVESGNRRNTWGILPPRLWNRKQTSRRTLTPFCMPKRSIPFPRSRLAVRNSRCGSGNSKPAFAEMRNAVFFFFYRSSTIYPPDPGAARHSVLVHLRVEPTSKNYGSYPPSIGESTSR